MKLTSMLLLADSTDLVVGIGVISVLWDETWPLEGVYLFTGLSVMPDELSVKLRFLRIWASLQTKSVKNENGGNWTWFCSLYKLPCVIHFS